MKNILLIVLMLGTFLAMSSCEKDSGTDPNNNNNNTPSEAKNWNDVADKIMQLENRRSSVMSDAQQL